MPSTVAVLYLIHLIGLALGMGAATTKTALLLKCRREASFIATFNAASKTITRLIIAGLVLLVVSGVAWFFVGGLSVSAVFVAKLLLVAAVFVLGPVIDNVVTPRFNRLAPAPGVPASIEFLTVRRQYIALELLATSLFYIVAAVWVLH